MQELSIGELDSLVLKAYRGAGFSWGLAQEAGRAAAWLAVRGLPAAGCFAELLSVTDGKEAASLMPESVDGRLIKAVNPLCPVMTGAALSDFGWSSGTLELGVVVSPLIMLPFVAACAQAAGVALEVRVDDAAYRLSPDGQLLPENTVPCRTACASVVIFELAPNGNTDSSMLLANSRRATAPPAVMQLLETFAHRTYVPASEESRSGAGAGLTDND